jgi:hypothetical protein
MLREPDRIGRRRPLNVVHRKEEHMPIVMNMRWDGVTPGQYEVAREQVGWEQHRPEGGLIHIASFTEEGLRVTDVWETAEDFNRFVESRLMPVVQEIGIEGEPDVTITPMHAIWNPGVERTATAAV